MSAKQAESGQLGELLESFDSFCARARARLIAGHRRYRGAWRRRDNLAALQTEAEDAFVYGFFDWERARRRSRAKRGVS
jgi:hypothetical protein